MPSIPLRFQRPSNEQDFEALCRDLYRSAWKLSDLQQLGRRGHEQWGVDIVGIDDHGNLRAIQCRLHEEGKKLSEKEAEGIVAKALTFPEPLFHLTIATTAPRDPRLQLFAIRTTKKHIKKSLFRLEIASWDDLSELLEKHPEVAEQYLENPSPAQGRQILERVSALSSGQAAILSATQDLATAAGDAIDQAIDHAASFLKEGQPEVTLVLLGQIERHHEPRLTNHHRFRVAANKGNAAKLKEDFEEAARYYIEARAFSDGEKARHLESVGYLFLGDIKRARETALDLRAAYPTSVLPHSILIHTAPPDVSVSDLAAELDAPASADANVLLALALRSHLQGNNGKAEAYAREVLERDNKAVGGKEILAVAVLAQELHLRRARPLSSGEEESRARIREATGLLEGLADTLRLMGPKTHLARIQFRLSHAYHLLGEQTTAEQQLASAALLNPQDPEIAVAQAFSFLDGGMLDEAMAALARIKPPYPSNVAFAMARILGRRRTGDDVKRGLELLRAGLESAVGAPVTLRSLWVELLVKLRIELGEGHEAFVDLDLLPPAFLTSGGLNSLKALVLEQIGNREAALEAALAASQALLPDTPETDRLRTARMLARLGSHAAAAKVWRSALQPFEVDNDVLGMLNSAHLAGEDEILLEFCRELRANGVLDSDAVRMEVGAAKRRSPKLAAETAEVILGLCRDEKIAREVRLMRSHIGLEINDLSLLERDASLLPTVDEVSPDQGRAVVEVLRHYDDPMAAVTYAYKLLRNFPDHALAHHGLIAAMLLRDPLPADAAFPRVVQPATAVKYAPQDSDTEEWVVIEDEPNPSLSRHEVAPSDPLAQRMAGKGVGDRFFLREGGPQPRQATIIEILHKAVFRFRECISKWELHFPNEPFVQQFSLGKSEVPEEALAPILRTLEDKDRHLAQIESAYRDQPVPLGLVAGVLHTPVFDVIVHRFVGRTGLPLKCSPWTGETLASAEKAIKQADALVLDSSAVAAVFFLGWLDHLKSFPTRLLISENTLYRVRQAEILTTDTTRPATSIGKIGGRLLMVDTPPQSLQDLRSQVEQFVAGLSAVVEVVTGPVAPPELDRAKWAQLTEAIGRSELDAVLLARLPRVTLWTDDLSLASFGQAEFGVRRVWTEFLVRWLAAGGFVAEGEASEAALALLERNYQHTSLTTTDIQIAATKAAWDVEKSPLSLALARFRDDAWETGGIVRLAGQTLVRLWQTRLSDAAAEVVTVRILHQLAARKEGVATVIALLRNLSAFFGLDALNANRAEDTIRAWLATRPRTDNQP